MSVLQNQFPGRERTGLASVRPSCVLSEFLPAGSVHFWLRSVGSSTTLVDSCVSSWGPISFNLMNSDDLLLDGYTLRVVKSSWRIKPFIMTQSSFLYVIIFLVVKWIFLKLIHLHQLSFNCITVKCLALSWIQSSVCLKPLVTHRLELRSPVPVLTQGMCSTQLWLCVSPHLSNFGDSNLLHDFCSLMDPRRSG